VNVYFKMKPCMIWSDPRHDVVFRDGELITLAGK
jgi:hypothetical protein